MIWTVEIENDEGTATGWTDRKPEIGAEIEITGKNENGMPIEIIGIVTEILEEKEDWE